MISRQTERTDCLFWRNEHPFNPSISYVIKTAPTSLRDQLSFLDCFCEIITVLTSGEGLIVAFELVRRRAER